MRGVLLMLFVSVFSSFVFSQTPAFKHYTVKDGLPGGTVYQAIQDNNGYIWFATNQGVSRFDGNSFKNFSKEDGLPDNDIIKIYIDSKNNLWFISMLGITSVLTQGKIIAFPACENVSAFSEDVVSKKIYLISGVPGKFNYYVADNRVNKWEFTGERFSNFYNRPILKYSDMSKRIYFTTGRKDLICTVVKRTGTENYSRDYPDTGFPAPFGKPIFLSANRHSDAFIFYSLDSIYLYTTGKLTGIQSLKDLDLNINHNNDISALNFENDSILWLSTRNHGLIRLSDFNNQKKTAKYFFQDTYCTSFIKDNEGGYWLTTLDNGVYYIPYFEFRTVPQQPEFISNQVKCIKTVDGETVIAGFADGNILEINSRQLHVKRFVNWPISKKNSRIIDVYPYGKNLLVGTDMGIYELDRDKHYERLFHTSVKSIFVNGSRQIFVAVSDGVYILQQKKVKYIFQERATCLTGLGKSSYIGTLKGLYKLSEGRLENLGNTYPEVAGNINHITASTDADIWVSTQQGITIIRNNKTYNIRKEEGLPGISSKHVLLKNKIAWVSTDRGLAKISYAWKNAKLEYTIHNISEADGLISNDVNQTAASNGFVWVATSEGISYFPEGFTTYSSSEPALYINKIMVGSIDIPIHDTITIKPEQQLSIHLSAISYRSGKALRYEYRFLPLSEKWKLLENNRVEFTSLPYGNFRLEMRAVDRWGKRSIKPTFVTIINNPPFWRTWWFEAISYLVSLILIILVFQLYSRSRQKKKEKAFNEKRKVLELEMMAFRAQINPHFIFNCLSSIQHHILKSDPESANRYLHKLSTLIRKTLQSSASPMITISEEISIIEIFLDLQKLRFGNRMNYSLSYPEDMLTQQLRIPSMIIQPFIENAVKHGISPLRNKTGFININISRYQDRIICVIEDNGPGINASKKIHKTDTYTSMGSSITEGRIQAINSIQEEKILLDIHDKKEVTPNEEGTIVTLTFMINASHEYKNGNY